MAAPLTRTAALAALPLLHAALAMSTVVTDALLRILGV
ncbi:hypothetical protein SAMN05216207_104128 [Pseudonocardia ammonioxydans]|uniref:Uncharacterized protein n=1 Tax=Pseudonocardia ammonioxydans TaxID=260086 RepID=A0A1I5FWY2_PSUAM|nr:hypothetical protein SAMN05216207_104128 [Pseudonocardia ammonioxydans]